MTPARRLRVARATEKYAELAEGLAACRDCSGTTSRGANARTACSTRGRAYDALGLAVPRNPLAGGLGLVLLLRWGLAREFEREVPASHLQALGGVVAVSCPCGTVGVLVVGELVPCAGACDRWWLRTPAGVRVARWPGVVESDVDADARIAREAMGGV